MEIGDLGYLIFLIIVAVANVLRGARKNKEQADGPGFPKRSRQKPVEHQHEASDPPKAPQSRRPKGIPRPKSDPPSETEEPWKRMVEELFGDAQEDLDGPYRPQAPTASKPAPASPKLKEVRADGYREGESLTDFAERLRREGRIKLQKRHLEAEAWQSAEEGLDFQFSLRDAVIYDAIWRRPYT